MKKLLSVFAVMLVLAMSFSLTVSADAFTVVPNPNTTVPYGTPTMDGTVDSGVYSAVVDLSNTTCGHFWDHNPMSSQANLYYAFDENGLYVAAEVTEGLEAIDERDGTDLTGYNQFNYSTDFDDLDITDDGTNRYGWNGDVMGIMVDPFGALIGEGFIGGSDFSAWYLVGLFEGDNARVYRSQSAADGEITDQCNAAGYKTANGWNFEVMIPWDIIIEDTDYASIGMVALDKETIVKEGTYLRVGAMYHDRFFDEEQGGLGTWGRYIVVPTTLADGSPGPGGVGENIASYGIELTLGAIKGTTPEPEDTTTAGNNETNPNDVTTAPETEVVDVTDASGNKVTDASGNKVTAVVTKAPSTTKGQNTGATTGQNSTQTLDITIAVALGTLAVSGIGIVASKKRR